MKAVSFLSVAFMAASALAAPLVPVVDTQGGVDSVVKEVTNVAGGAVGGAVGTVGQVVRKRDIADAAGFLSALKGTQSDLSGPLGSLKDITEGVRAGDITKQEATRQAAPQLRQVEKVLTGLTSELSGVSGLNVASIDVGGVTSLVNVLVAEVLTTMSDLTTVLGIQAPLASILTSVVGLVAKLLNLVVGLVGELVPGIIAGLTPLLAGVGSGVLAPVLTPVASLLAGL